MALGEQRRPPQPWNGETEMIFRILETIVFVVGIVMFVGTILFVLLTTLSETGPNCPGKDPSWIGWCDEAPLEN